MRTNGNCPRRRTALLRGGAAWSVLALLLVCGCSEKGRQVKRFREFVREHREQVKPILVDYNRAWWEANTTGEEEAFDRRADLEVRLTEAYSDSEDFAFLRDMREKDLLDDPVEKRLLLVLYLKYLGNQGDPELRRQIIEQGAKLEQTFANFRGLMAGREVSDNDIEEVLTESVDSGDRREAWEASKQVGAAVAADLRELVKMRNEAARSLGYRDHFALSLALTEVDEEELFSLFDELDRRTAGPYQRLKARLDAALAKRYGVTPGAMMPWHYSDPFFQEAPDITEVDLDGIYEDEDILALARRYYEGLGFEVQDILDRSDLYEREGKNQHAFATDIDREGDVRVLLNLKPNSRWMDTALHELGHAVYDQYIDPEVPWLLRERSHSITTEGIAMMFGRFARSPVWLEEMGLIGPERTREVAPQLREMDALGQLIFSRWCQVMVRFERELYANPDREDLNDLWWELVGRYQGLVKPAGRNNPDWAAKIHFVVAPVYYHSYMLGELFAAQLHATLAQEVLGLDDPRQTAFVEKPRVGDFLREKVFGPGNTMNWRDLVVHATGRPLDVDAYARRFAAWRTES
jgi:peptidyl-dipeptidase A